MKIEDFTVLESINPLKIKEKPTPRTIEGLGKMVVDKQFFQIMKYYRNAYHVPPEGYDIKQFIGQTYDNLPIVHNEMLVANLTIFGNSMRGKMDFADDFIPELILMYFFNAVIDFADFKGFVTRPIQFVMGKGNISYAMAYYPCETGAILLPHTIKRKTLILWIKDHWSEIEKIMDENLPQDPMGKKLHKEMANAIEIIRLKDEEKLSFSEVSDKMSALDPEDESLKDDDNIRKLYYRYKEMLNFSSSEDNSTSGQ